MRVIYCHKLQKEATGLEKQPFKNELGERIFEHISQEAWQMWVVHQTMLINEYRLNLIDKQAKEFLRNEMQKFFFD